MPFNPEPCCTNQCATPITTTESPIPGTTSVANTVGANTAAVTFYRSQRLDRFAVFSNGFPVAGTISAALGSVGTAFTFTPAAAPGTGKQLSAYVTTRDIKRGCQRKFNWVWST